MGNSSSSYSVLPIHEEEDPSRLETPRLSIPPVHLPKPSRKRDLDKWVKKFGNTTNRNRKMKQLEDAIQLFPCTKTDVATTFAWSFKYLYHIGVYADDVEYIERVKTMEKRYLEGVLTKDMEFWVDKSIFFTRFFTLHQAMKEIRNKEAWNNITLSHAIFQKHFWDYVQTHYLDKYLFQEWKLVHLIEMVIWEELQQEMLQCASC